MATICENKQFQVLTSRYSAKFVEMNFSKDVTWQHQVRHNSGVIMLECIYISSSLKAKFALWQ